ncbi:MAG: chemotaxis protein CheW [Methylovulum sp.]|nr:chemotaxis protein CheW [Methylovulum sp.]
MQADSPDTVGALTASSNEQSALPIPTGQTDAGMMLGFRVGDLGFLLPISLHCEVLDQLSVNPIPNVEPWFNGLLNIRGNIVPVIDLHMLLDIPVNTHTKRYLFAIGRGEKTMALWIDGYPHMLNGLEKPLPSPHSLPALPDRLRHHAVDTYVHNGQIWLSLQFDLFFKSLGRQDRPS